MSKKKFALYVRLLAVPLLGGLTLAGCSAPDESPPVDASGTTTPASSETGTDEPGGGAAPADALPYTQELNGRRLTVESFGTSAPATDLWELEEGNEVVYVQVRVENVDAEPWESNVVQFFLFDESNETYGPSFYHAEVGAPPDAVTLEAGDVVEGYVPFEVPAGTTGLRLEYAVDLSAGAVITVRLN